MPLIKALESHAATEAKTIGTVKLWQGVQKVALEVAVEHETCKIPADRGKAEKPVTS